MISKDTSYQNAKISVILPVFNVEGYIDECIQSLKAQTLRELEFIFVDDCGTDNSMVVVESWAREDNRVRIIHNPNNIGAGPSRNAGIEAACGEYLSFIDPDDYISSDFYTILYTAANKNRKHDIVKGTRCKVYENGSVIDDKLNNKIRKQLSSNKPLYGAFTYEHQTALYHRSLFSDIAVRYGAFPNAEDTTFLLRCCYQTSDIVIQDDAVYYYVQHENSSVNKPGTLKIHFEIDSLSEKIDFLNEKGLDSAACKYLLIQAKTRIKRYQLLLKAGLVSRNDYVEIAEHLSAVLRRIPVIDTISKNNRQIQEVLLNCPLTTPGKRSPGEGDIRISVILPVHNPGPGINKCIESLRAQLLDGLEFIFVDDCSTDESMKTVEAWASEDTRVHIVRNKDILGAGQSRNQGIAVASGDYLSFVDPDDYISLDYYEILYAAAIEDGGHDISKGCVYKVSDSDEIIEEPSNALNKRIQSHMADGQPLWKSFTGDHFSAIYHRRLFFEGDAKYGTSKHCEDITFLLYACYGTNDIVFCDKAHYAYVQRQTSLSHIVSPARYESDLDAFEESLAFLLSKGPLGKNEYSYLASKLAYRYRAYQKNMYKSSDMSNHYPTFAARVRDIIYSTPDPNQMLNNSRELKKLFARRKSIAELLRKKENKNNVTVSVIIPVYNVESWIDECIESLKRQKLSGLEFIFVDDCGSDSSMNAVETWAKEDYRVRIIRNPHNMGTGLSRNEGIKVAQGEYLSFIDPDDLVSDDFYELLYAAAKKGRGHDIAKGSVCHVPDPYDRTMVYPTDDRQNNRIKRRLSKSIPLYRLFTYEHWTAIYKRSLVLSGKCLYGASCTAQDTTFQLRVCLLTNDIILEERALYYYRQRGNSATKASALRRTCGELDALDEKIDTLLERTMDKHALIYVREMAELVLRRFQDVLGKGMVSHRECPQIIRRLTNSLSRIPDYELVIKESSDLRVLFSNPEVFMQDTNADSSLGPQISVILPFFNPGDGLEKCLYSLRQQLLGGLEFIFIDDCSTDGSIEDVREWAAQDPRVRIINNDKNIGPGPSRNKGICEARGKYLSFIDPDDYISSNFFELLYTKVCEGGCHDIVKGRCEVVSSSNTKKHYYININSESVATDLQQGAPLWHSFNYEHWTALYRQTLFQDSSVRYGTTRISEDSIFLLRIGSVTNDIVFENDAVYYYTQRSESATSHYDIKWLEQFIFGLKEKLNILICAENSDYVKDYFEGHLRSFFSPICKAIKDTHLTDITTQDQLEVLHNVLKTLPHYEYLMSELPEYSLLLNHGLSIDYIRKNNVQRLNAWFSILRQHPELASEYATFVQILASRVLKAASPLERFHIKKQLKYIEKLIDCSKLHTSI